jgi:hypothetical protein
MAGGGGADLLTETGSSSTLPSTGSVTLGKTWNFLKLHFLIYDLS